MITYLSAIILGIVEGLTEFLPISSTAHLTLVSELMGIVQSDTVKSFEIVIQSGAIGAVVVLYWKRFLDREVLKRVVSAFIPTALVGFVLYKLIKSYLIGNIVVTLSAMCIGGIILIVSEKMLQKKNATVIDPANTEDVASITYKNSIIIGLAQAIAVIPGVSRSAATIIGGLWLGISRKIIVEFSFLLAVPTILAAAGYDLLKNRDVFSSNDIGFLIVGFAVSFITAFVAIKFFISYVQRHSFIAFGVYRIILAVILSIFFYMV